MSTPSIFDSGALAEANFQTLLARSFADLTKAADVRGTTLAGKGSNFKGSDFFVSRRQLNRLQKECNTDRNKACIRLMIANFSQPALQARPLLTAEGCIMLLDMMITAWRKEAPGSDKEALKVQIQKVVASFQKQGVFTDSYLKSGIQVITKEGTLQIHE